MKHVKPLLMALIICVLAAIAASFAAYHGYGVLWRAAIIGAGVVVALAVYRAAKR